VSTEPLSEPLRNPLSLFDVRGKINTGVERGADPR